MTADAMDRARAKPRQGASGIWLLGLGSGLGAAMAPGFLAMTAILLTPGLLAFFTDPSPGKAAARPVLLLGAALAVAPLFALAGSGGGVAAAIALACEPRALAMAWSVQGVGWLTVELAPWLIRWLLDSAARAQVLALRRARRGIEAEWGIPQREGEDSE